MTTIGPMTSAMSRAVNLPLSDRGEASFRLATSPTKSQDELREAFTDFVGQTFFGQMIKSMRSTVGKPAYFHGGQAEEIFRSQLDQAIVDQMTEATADRFANPLFERQFPNASASHPESNTGLGLDQLGQLSRR